MDLLRCILGGLGAIAVLGLLMMGAYIIGYERGAEESDDD